MKVGDKVWTIQPTDAYCDCLGEYHTDYVDPWLGEIEKVFDDCVSLRDAGNHRAGAYFHEIFQDEASVWEAFIAKLENVSDGHLKDFKTCILEIDKARVKLASLPKGVKIEAPRAVEVEEETVPDRPITAVRHEWLD